MATEPGAGLGMRPGRRAMGSLLALLANLVRCQGYRPAGLSL